MTGSRQVRVAVWGLGGHAVRKVLPALVEADRTELYGVTTRNPETAAEAVSRHGCHAWQDPDDMLADAAVDAVYIATPTGTHHEQGVRVLEAGKHLWCEKSLTESGRRSLALTAIGRQRGLAVCEAFMYRYHPHFLRVNEVVASPGFGPIASLSCRFGIPHLDRGGFRYSSTLGGGALLDVGCYVVNLAVCLLGEPLEVAVHRAHRPDGFEVDVDGYAVLTASSGARAHLEWGYGLAYRNELFVWGASQSVYTDRVFSKQPDHQASLIVADAHGNTRRETVSAASSFVHMLDAFAATVWDEGAREQEWTRAEAQARQLDRLLMAPTQG